MKTASQQSSWHQLSADEAVQLLETDLQTGLLTAEAHRRRQQYGPNRITTEKPFSALKRFLRQFNAPLVYILLIASGITFAIGEWVDASVIFGVAFVNGIIGYLQETKAERAIEALAKMVVTETTVRRHGNKLRVPSEDLVPGDVVLLQAGDKVPADLRLTHVRNLQVDESALTGESIPVQKQSTPLPFDTILAARTNLAFAGTSATHGQGEGVVWAIGDKTEMGRIASLVSETVEILTPLTRKIAHFSKILLFAILGLALGSFIVGLWRGETASEMFLAAVAIAVGAIPEGLPAAITITLALGVARMAKRRAIIRKLPAVETLGSVTVICSDKTGTLTENQMTVQEIFAGGRLYQVSGSGYDAPGEILFKGKTVSAASSVGLTECLKAGLLCNDSQLVRKAGRLVVQGDPTEAALIIAAQKGGLSGPELNRCLPRVDAIPFESEQQYMATLHRDEDGLWKIIYKKGAVERLLERCSTALDAQGKSAELDKEQVRKIAEQLAAQGLRVLAFARREVPPDQHRIDHHHVEAGLTFLGLQGMIDPPRREAIEAVHRCQNAGIRVKMITGDHLGTATAIAKQLGLDGAKGKKQDMIAITGKELERCSESELSDIAESATVFARVAPEQKLRLVAALQERGHIVAMTGDGVNDAPALKRSDVGVAMGISGTDVAKAASDMLLTDDNFASIEAAVEEGRGVFDNLTKFIIWTLPTNLGEGLIILVAILAGVSLPLFPTQLLWINMTTSVLLGLMLVFEPKESDLMSRRPRDPGKPILTVPLFMRTGLVTLILLAGAFGLFLWEQSAHGLSVAEARTIVVNVVVMVEVFYLLNCRSFTRSMFSVGVLSNPSILAGIATTIAAQLLFTYAGVMNRLFHSAPIPLEAWFHIIGVAVFAYLIIELEKWARFGGKRKGPRTTS